MASRTIIRNLRTASVRLAPAAPPPNSQPPNLLGRINLGSSTAGPSTSRLADTGPEHIGPFPLPHDTREAQIRAASAKWSQLGTGQKVGWLTTQTASLVVVLAGAGLFVLVAYSTGTELFSEASPTRIFEDCVERVKANEELHTVLIGPLTFHGANSSNRLRRNRRVSSQLIVDPKTGVETMLIKFWVEGQENSNSSDGAGEETLWEKTKKFVGPAIWEDSSKPGSFVPKPSEREIQQKLELEEKKKLAMAEWEKSNQSWSAWLNRAINSAFAGLVPSLKSEQEQHRPSLLKRARKPELGQFSSGECVAELRKDPETGNFVYQQLFCSIPDTRHPNAYRVDIPTEIVGESTKLADKLRFWRRTKTVAA